MHVTSLLDVFAFPLLSRSYFTLIIYVSNVVTWATQCFIQISLKMPNPINVL